MLSLSPPPPPRHCLSTSHFFTFLLLIFPLFTFYHLFSLSIISLVYLSHLSLSVTILWIVADLSLSLFVTSFIYLYVHPYVYLPIYPSIHPSIYLSISIHSSIHLCIYPSTHPSIYLSMHKSIWMCSLPPGSNHDCNTGPQARDRNRNTGIRHGCVLHLGALLRETPTKRGGQGPLRPQAQRQWRHRRCHRPLGRPSYAVNSPISLNDKKLKNVLKFKLELTAAKTFSLFQPQPLPPLGPRPLKKRPIIQRRNQRKYANIIKT